ncbi:MAG: nucleotidyltransferase family protein [Verrucomicrobiota bacterium]|nr:nucleotidyltransferase family protein [Verrucomicrobiota bacterium]
MNKQRFSKMKALIVSILKKNGVKRASLFGSFARGEATKKSDVDLLIEFRGKKKDLLDHISLIQELEEALHRKVDVLTYKYIHPALKKQILAEQVRIL